ncbi:MAG: stage V sporulation protein S [Chloroflexi bacterium]|nr:stage V sporulation protein S [Chloroflexota bacterium]
MDVIRVASQSDAHALAGAIAAAIRAHLQAEVQAVGPMAVNQASKAIIIAQDCLARDNLRIYCIPRFQQIEIDKEARTAIGFEVAFVEISDENRPNPNGSTP